MSYANVNLWFLKNLTRQPEAMKVIIRNNTVWLLRTVDLISEHVPSVENNPILFPVLFRYFHNIPEISHKNRERLRSLMYNHSSWQSMVSRPWNILSFPVFLFWKWKHKASFRTRLGFIFCNSPCRREQPFLSTCERRYSRTKKKRNSSNFKTITCHLEAGWSLYFSH